MFAIEAVEYLHNQGIYLLDSEDTARKDYSTYNSYSLVKNILTPLVEDFREVVIDSKINSNIDILAQHIGYDNFQALVNVVNQVDYLCSQGVERKLYGDRCDPMCVAYDGLLDKTASIYANIYEYTAKNEIKGEQKTRIVA